MSRLSYERLVHADWSSRAQGRWSAEAVRDGNGWRAGGPAPVGDLPTFVDDLVNGAKTRSTLAGFDFPIGLPASYGEKTELPDFKTALDLFGDGDWAHSYEIASEPDQISIHRPFYPAKNKGKQAHLTAGHNVSTVKDLLRHCERGGPGSTEAGCLFWTLGAKQVGRAAIAGWRHVIRPAWKCGARIWPFADGSVGLADQGGLTLCETYPADVYRFLKAAFVHGESKTKQEHRRRKASALLAWAKGAHVTFDDALTHAIRDGFGPESGKDDGFDAVVGLFGMIAVADGQRAPGAPDDGVIRKWEGWILGRSPASLPSS